MDLINFVNITTELNLKKDIETFLGISMTINAVLTKCQRLSIMTKIFLLRK